MSPITREERLERRIQDLYANDPQFAAAKPATAITAAIERPGLPLPQIIETVMTGYADRPALAQRSVEFVTDAGTGHTTLRLLPTSKPSATASFGTASAHWPTCSAPNRR